MPPRPRSFAPAPRWRKFLALCCVVGLGAGAGTLNAQRAGRMELSFGLGIGGPIFGPVVTLRYFPADAIGLSCGLGVVLVEPVVRCNGDLYANARSGTSIRVSAAVGSNALANAIAGSSTSSISRQSGPAFGPMYSLEAGIAHGFAATSARNPELSFVYGVLKGYPLGEPGDREWRPGFDADFAMNWRVRRP